MSLITMKNISDKGHTNNMLTCSVIETSSSVIRIDALLIFHMRGLPTIIIRQQNKKGILYVMALYLREYITIS